MTKDEITQLAEQVAKTYNPEGLSPFPYDKLVIDKRDLKILFAEKLPSNISGLITFIGEDATFAIIINKEKQLIKQNFTIAHEIGHYFLHKEEIKRNKNLFVDGDNVLESAALYDKDDAIPTQLEIEANNFGASLIMPEALVRKAWEKLKDVDDCAEIFNVSIEAMSIRLSRLDLI